MKDFLKRLFVFGALFAVVSWGTSRLFDGTVVADSLLGRTDRQFEATRSGFRNMVYGDSHATRAIVPAELPGTFNLATQGENYIETSYRLRWTLERAEVASELKLAVLPLDLHSLSSFRTNRFDYPGYTRRYVDFLEVGRRTGRLPHYVTKTIQAAFVSYFEQRDNIWAWVSRRVLRRGEFQSLERGWLPSDEDFGKLPDRRARAEKRARFHFDGAELQDPIAVAYLEESLALLRGRGTTVLLVRYPVTREYLDAALAYYESAGLAPLTGERYADGESVFWFDGLTLWPDRPELFMDEDHLNTAGARLFTQELLRWISGVEGR